MQQPNALTKQIKNHLAMDIREMALDPIMIRRKPFMINSQQIIIIQAIFGGDNPELARQMFVASKRLIGRANPLLFFSKRAHFSGLGFSPWDRWKKAKSELCCLLDQVIENRAESGQKRHDILALLCQAKYEDGEAISRDIFTRSVSESELFTL